MKRLLLISNSYQYGRGLLDHCESQIASVLGTVREILFVPYAVKDWSRYTALMTRRMEQMGCAMKSIHTVADPKAEVRVAEALFIGGGNTFLLLRDLYTFDLIEVIRERVGAGIPYIGSSAGTNVACVSIKTTNDMPIVQPRSFDGLGLVPFNINPHYIEPDPSSTHMGETRDDRIREFHEHNEPAVLGLREGSMLLIVGGELLVEGQTGARVFRKCRAAVDFGPGERLDFLLEEHGGATGS